MEIIAQHLESLVLLALPHAIVDLRGRTVTCPRPGNTPFILIAPVGNGSRRVEVLAPDGMVLGLNLDRGERFARCLEELALPIEKGDLLFFFTDGISEAMDGDGACFGESRLSAL